MGTKAKKGSVRGHGVILTSFRWGRGGLGFYPDCFSIGFIVLRN